MKSFVLALAVVVVASCAAAGLGLYVVSVRGLSTRVEPTGIEVAAARLTRRLATPRHMRDAHNPVAQTAEVRAEGREHFADHCASCHGNDGSGDTALGRSFYPPAPDMRRAATQELSDGELFSIIENGIRLTGMPAWGDGTAEGQRGSWALVHFLRGLSSLTEDELSEMEARNPRTPAEFRADEEARRFLAGDAGDAPPESAPHDGGHR